MPTETKLNIAIIGAGSASVSLCLQLQQMLRKFSDQFTVEISVFEKTDKIGRGLAYSKNESSYILNLPKNVMEPVCGCSGQFSMWLEKQRTRCQHDTQFPPRYFFGNYLEDLACKLEQETATSNVKIAYITNTEITDIQEVDGLFQLESDKKKYTANYVVLCTGHMPSSKYQEFVGKQGFYHDVWDETIHPDDDVIILGTRLTAIDVALKLQACSHRGKIWMVSGSGLLPAVLSKEIPDYPLKHLTINNISRSIKDMPDKTRLDVLSHLFWKEISDAENKSISFADIAKSHTDMAPLSWLENQIARAELAPKPWQQVLFAIYPVLSTIWSMLEVEDQLIFLRNYYSIFMTYLAAFPLENAHKIMKIMCSGQLTVLGGIKAVNRIDNQYVIRLENQQKITAKHVFNATGSGHDPLQVPLYRNMIQKRLMCKDERGGIVVDPHTLQVMSCSGKIHPRLFAIGELTRGTCLAVTDMGRIAVQASRVAAGIQEDIHSTNPAFK